MLDEELQRSIIQAALRLGRKRDAEKADVHGKAETGKVWGGDRRLKCGVGMCGLLLFKAGVWGRLAGWLRFVDSIGMYVPIDYQWLCYGCCVVSIETLNQIYKITVLWDIGPFYAIQCLFTFIWMHIYMILLLQFACFSAPFDMLFASLCPPSRHLDGSRERRTSRRS